MKPMREKIQSKLNSMASILLDDIVVPEQEIQSGNETIVASFYDKYENKFTFTLSLNVSPKEIAADQTDDQALTMADQISMILEKLTLLESDVAGLKVYHQTSEETGGTENTEETNESEENNGET